MSTILNEIPSSLNQLARMVVRGFYNVEDALIIDMLIRHPCELSKLFSKVQVLHNNAK